MAEMVQCDRKVFVVICMVCIFMCGICIGRLNIQIHVKESSIILELYKKHLEESRDISRSVTKNSKPQSTVAFTQGILADEHGRNTNTIHLDKDSFFEQNNNLSNDIQGQGRTVLFGTVQRETNNFTGYIAAKNSNILSEKGLNETDENQTMDANFIGNGRAKDNYVLTGDIQLKTSKDNKTMNDHNAFAENKETKDDRNKPYSAKNMKLEIPNDTYWP